MDRPRSLRVWLSATLLVVLALASTVVWKTLRARGFGRPFRVLKITAEPDGDPSPGARLASAPNPAGRALLDDVARRNGIAPPAPPGPVRRVEGTTFIASVDEASPLSPTQRARLTSVFQLAAAVQSTIDATNDPNTRADLQRHLDDQVRTRLQMILPKEALALMGQVDEDGGLVAFSSARDKDKANRRGSAGRPQACAQSLERSPGVIAARLMGEQAEIGSEGLFASGAALFGDMKAAARGA